MNSASHSIYRASALRRYFQTDAESVSLAEFSPHLLVCLWILLGLLFASGLLVALTLVRMISHA
jgi:hypothetical protein